jgi:hypothetical protein
MKSYTGLALQNLHTCFGGGATKSVVFFAKGTTQLDTQCTIEWCYELALAIKGLEFMTPLNG